jgi:elongator complex protein 3
MKVKFSPFKLAIQYLIKDKVKTLAGLDSAKRKIAKKFKITTPSNVELLKAYHNLLKNKRLKADKNLEFLLKKRKVRSLSGIVNVSALTKPYSCPGKCVYCPSQKGIPKSYLNGEPAVMRAVANKFNPYRQVQMRINALEKTGHPTDKIELRIIGGTWSFYPIKYQRQFIKECFRGCNEFGRPKIPACRLPLSASQSLKKEQRKNERAKHRIVGLSIETRPDFINEKEIKRLRELEATMVELGVQSIYEDVLKINRRGHQVEAIIRATKLLKDAGFKTLYQMMPNLPGSTLKRDEKMFKELFSNPDFQPDLLKIYPCVLLKEAPLYKLWLKKKYKPYSAERLTALLKSIKKQIPYYVRIQRIIRDIPAQNIVAGPGKISNLRQIIAEDMKEENWGCKCIRCREVKENYNPKEKLCLFRQDYGASGGREIFLSFENKERTKIYSLLRLRIPSYLLNPGEEKPIFSVLKNSAIVRELHTYGQLVPVAEKKKAPQHRGLGKKLMREAERIVRAEFGRSAKEEFGIRNIAVISGVGVRGYYRKLGYRLKDTYMLKRLAF